MKATFITLSIIASCLFLGVVNRGCNWLGQAADVVSEQANPHLLLKRYEWFKSVAAESDKKVADIQVYKSRLTSMEKSYANTPRKDWDRTDKEQFNLWESEVAGVVASYNGLAAEYNSAMAKINYRFTNVGDMPAGATEPLRREVRPYVTE